MKQPGYGRIVARARNWWQSLQSGPGNSSGDRAALARLRRETDIVAAMADEAVLDLYRTLGLGNNPSEVERWLPRVAVIALVLAHVREDTANGSAVRAVGRTRFDCPNSAAMKPLRFRRLLACRDDEDLVRQMRRMVMLAGRRIDVGDLAGSLLFWNEKIQARWAFEYFAPDVPPPSATPIEETADTGEPEA
jgi:CRISPR system Cascade subunit CasB